MCAHQTTKFQYMKQKLTELKREIDKCTITVGDFNTYLATDKTTGQEISKDGKDVNNMSSY